MNNTLNRMIQSETGNKYSSGSITPVYAYKFDDKNINNYHRIIFNISSEMWSYFCYSGLITPWHEEFDNKKMFNFQQRTFIKLIKHLEDNDISLRSYCILICIVSDYTKYERPALLFGQRNHWSWIKKLREYCGSRENLSDVASFMEAFLKYQIIYHKRAFVQPKSIIDKESDGKRKGFITYYRISDRIKQLQINNVNYIDWLEKKFDNCIRFKPNQNVLIKTIVNHNGLDPSLSEIKEVVNDPWNEIRKFLGLSYECKFPDDCIPKGWAISHDDFENSDKIIKITKDGFYYYSDGTQRRGKRHYARNTYLCIKCTPDNFAEFVDKWHNKILLTSTPTWKEYNKYAVYPGRWNEDGTAKNGRGKPVKWRKK